MITVFTPSYNRAHTLHRVYESLKKQTYRDFEWLIVNDGSTDETQKIVADFQAQDNFFPIRCLEQANQGKHMATNRAVREARGAFFVTLDSDDGCKPEALERLMAMWNSIPEMERSAYKGVSCRCCRPDRPNEIICTPLPGHGAYIDSNDHDLRYRHKVKGELWGMTRREVMLENPYPAIENLRYYPEGVYWGRLGLRYKTRYFDEPLRIYYADGAAQDAQLTKRVHARETYYAREYFMSPDMIRAYFWCDPLNFYRQAVGFVRDGLLTGRSFRELMGIASASRRGGILCLLGYFPGRALAVREKSTQERQSMKAGLFFKRLKRKVKGGTLSGDEPLNLRKTLKRFVETGFFHIFGGTVINKIIAFLTSVVLVRILTAEEYGVFTYAWNIYSMLLLLDGVGMASAVLQICSERSTEEAYMRAVGHYGLKCGALFDLLLAVVLFAIGTWAPLSISGARGALQLLSGLPIFHFLFDVISNYLRAEKRNRDYAALKTFNTAVIFAVSMLGTWVLREKGLILGYYAAYILTLCVCLLRRDVGLLLPAERPEKSVRRAFWGIAVVSMCNTALSQLLYLLDIFVLGVVDPQETVLASYRVATIIPTALNFIPVALITYVYPYFAEHRMDGRWCLDRYKKMLIGLGAFNLITGCVLIAGAPFFVRLIFGETYSDVTPIFRLLIANYCISGTLRVPAGNLLVTQRKLKFNLFVAILSGLVNIAADFLFISWWGAMGAALATVLVVIITSVMNVSYLMYTFKSVSGKEG